MKCPILKKSKFREEKDTSGLLSSLVINTPLNKMLLVGPLVFYGSKMNEIVNMFLLQGDQFITEMHLRQSRFIYSACGSFTKNKE